MADKSAISNENQKLRRLLYTCIRELGFVQSVENCTSGLCATSLGAELVERGMALLGVKDLSAAEYPGGGTDGD